MKRVSEGRRNLGRPNTKIANASHVLLKLRWFGVTIFYMQPLEPHTCFPLLFNMYSCWCLIPLLGKLAVLWSQMVFLMQPTCSMLSTLNRASWSVRIHCAGQLSRHKCPSCAFMALPSEQNQGGIQLRLCLIRYDVHARFVLNAQLKNPGSITRPAVPRRAAFQALQRLRPKHYFLRRKGIYSLAYDSLSKVNWCPQQPQNKS